MTPRTRTLFVCGVAAATAAMSAAVYERLPATVAVHWNVQGQADGYGPRIVAAALMPLLILVLPWLFTLGRQILPRTDHIERSQGAIDTAVATLSLVLAVVHAMILGIAIGYPLPVHKVAIGCIGLALAAIGNVLGKTRSNHLIGIRTPWTMASETVWDKTNRLGGKVLVVEGLACLLAVPFLAAGATAPVAMLAGLCLTVLWLCWYSYTLFKREQPATTV